jgi:hypothetical protein
MGPRLGQVVLGLSGSGFALTQLAIRRLGWRGALVTESVCVGLAVRDAAMIATGVPARLRRGPALLLWLEMVAAVAAAGLGLRLVLGSDAVTRATAPRLDPLEVARRAAVGALFGLHTIRFRIYLRPDQGRRPVDDALSAPQTAADYIAS